MGILKSIAKTFSREKSISQTEFDHFFGGGSKGKGPYTKMTKEEQLAVVKVNSVVFSCVQAISRAFQEATLTIEVMNVDGEWEQVESHPYLDPFTKNKDISESEFEQYIAMHLELTGQSFLWEWKSRDGMVRELWPVPPSWVTINCVNKISSDPNSSRIINSYTIKPDNQCENGGSGTEYLVMPEDMVYTRFIDPSNLWNGLSPSVAASRYIQLESKAEVYKGEAVSNLSLPGIAVKTNKPLNPSQKADLRAVLKQKMGGDARQNAIMISGDNADIQLLNPLEDFDWKSYSHLNETRICSVFGVPPIVIGLWVGLENSPWSNTGEAKRWFYRNTVASLWSMIETGLTRALIPEAERGQIRYKFDLSEIQELKDDMNELSERASALFERGMLTRNEARNIIGYDREATGDVYKYSAATVLLPANDNVIPNTPPENSEADQAAGVEGTDLV